MSSIFAQMRGGEGGVAGSQPMSTAVHIIGAQINFRDLTPYLTFSFCHVFTRKEFSDLKQKIPDPKPRRKVTSPWWISWGSRGVWRACLSGTRRTASAPPPHSAFFIGWGTTLRGRNLYFSFQQKWSKLCTLLHKDANVAGMKKKFKISDSASNYRT